jgi:hypothetical protein
MGGISKNKVKQALKAASRVRSWKLLLILIPLMFLTATLLRFDHLGMVELRDRVLEADEFGTDEEIVDALNALKRYTFSHIVFNVVEENGEERVVFGTGRFYLEYQYTKKAKEELAKAEAALENVGENPHGNIFRKASDVCDALGKKYGWGYTKPYIDCMQTELAKFPVMDEIEDFIRAMIPPTALYRQEFASPIWYPSLAGIAILFSILLVVVIIIRFLIIRNIKNPRSKPRILLVAHSRICIHFGSRYRINSSVNSHIQSKAAEIDSGNVGVCLDNLLYGKMACRSEMIPIGVALQNKFATTLIKNIKIRTNLHRSHPSGHRYA